MARGTLQCHALCCCTRPDLLSYADVDLTKNPKDLVKDAGKAINKATPDLSEAPGPYDTAREQRDEANVSPSRPLAVLPSHLALLPVCLGCDQSHCGSD